MGMIVLTFTPDLSRQTMLSLLHISCCGRVSATIPHYYGISATSIPMQCSDQKTHCMRDDTQHMSPTERTSHPPWNKTTQRVVCQAIPALGYYMCVIVHILMQPHQLLDQTKLRLYVYCRHYITGYTLHDMTQPCTAVCKTSYTCSHKVKQFI